MTARPIEYRKYNQIKFYYGIVQKVLGEDDSDDNYNEYKGKYIIQFRIPDIIDNLNDDEWPLAHPIMKHTSQVFKGDNVLIMQLDTDLQDFVYFSNDISESTGIRYKNCIITLANDEFGDNADNSLTIDVVSLKEAGDDQHEPEEIDKVHSRILVNEKSIDLKTVGDEADVRDDNVKEFSDVLIIRGSDDNEKNITITSSKSDNDKSTVTIKDTSLEIDTKSKNKITVDGDTPKITIDSDKNTITLNGSEKSFKIEDDNKNSIIGDSQGIAIEDKSKNKVTLDAQGITIEDTNRNQAKLDAQGIKVTDKNQHTITMNTQGIDLKDMLTNELKTQTSGITGSSMLQSKMELGALVSLNNVVGGLASMISDLWTEMTTMATNLLTLASACAAIQFIGPGALTNGTAAAVPGCAASIGTIAAKMAMSKTIAK